jgi:hypothetical protein
MKQSFPLVVTTNGILTIRFSDSAVCQSFDVACVVDLTDFGDVLGIEVLDWQRQLSGGKIGGVSPSHPPRWAYDEEIDALSICISEGYSQIQRPTSCKVSLDASKGAVCLELLVPAASR